ncbi:probable nuclear transport factor 2 [Dreissena polymorpha]|uniref:Nuclear transport factor 2 n=1 Tax=Dreissena polymorpha TaxID=45954 RepID=A0A9D3Z0W5_DREPO|nr:probable nuclear transport factor 2 [Dreissena polymorpha]KAH3711008.1 hypothetical protein DPMN_070507 [Dreissena polymorpha]
MNPEFQSIGEAFVRHYYQLYDEGNKDALMHLYHDSALLTFEGDQKQGKPAIVEKHKSVAVKTAHAITRADCHPMMNGGILVAVLGQLKTEGEEKALGYTHTFVIQPEAATFFIVNEIFQLALHNF